MHGWSHMWTIQENAAFVSSAHGGATVKVQEYSGGVAASVPSRQWF